MMVEFGTAGVCWVLGWAAISKPSSRLGSCGSVMQCVQCCNNSAFEPVDRLRGEWTSRSQLRGSHEKQCFSIRLKQALRGVVI